LKLNRLTLLKANISGTSELPNFRYLGAPRILELVRGLMSALAICHQSIEAQTGHTGRDALDAGIRKGALQRLSLRMHFFG
jgi:hypothetical protein